MLGEIQDTCSDTEPLQPPLGGHGGPSHSEGQRGQSWAFFQLPGASQSQRWEERSLASAPTPGNGVGLSRGKDPTTSQQKVTGGPRLREQECRGAQGGPVRTERGMRKRRVGAGDCGQDRTLTASIQLRITGQVENS